MYTRFVDFPSMSTDGIKDVSLPSSAGEVNVMSTGARSLFTNSMADTRDFASSFGSI